MTVVDEKNDEEMIVGLDITGDKEPDVWMAGKKKIILLCIGVYIGGIISGYIGGLVL